MARKLLKLLFISSSAIVLLGIIAAAGTFLYLNPKLPEVEALKDVQLQEPLRVYSSEGLLIAEFGEVKRIPLQYPQFPKKMVQAILAAEDDRFFEHPGIDYQGLLRAAYHLVTTGQKGQGGSTITMQVARNFFLSRKKTYTRKLNEILLSLKIESELEKEEILGLYLNKIFLGHRSYGVAAAAQVYYGRELFELNTAQFAMIAGLPKAPSAYNPIANPERALIRRNYVLGRMLELGFINVEEHQQARNSPITAEIHRTEPELNAPYVAEMVRHEMVQRYGNEVYNSGMQVFTTVEATLQSAANQALHDNLMAYELRHGYRGPEATKPLAEEAGAAEWAATLEGFGPVGGLEPALVVALAEQSATVYLRDGSLDVLGWDGMKWARHYINDNDMGPEPTRASTILKRGQIIRLERGAEGAWQLAQIPEVSSALVSLRPQNGALLALVGGFDFYHSKFNRVTQAKRQPGSNFKPFVYSAALEHGFTVASLINDAPVVFDDKNLESEWRPENYSGKFYGPTRMREALINSRNLVSIRLLQSVGISTAIDYISRFGFEPKQLPRDLSLALGSANITPMELVRGYAVFANGGYLIEPFFIERIVDNQSVEVFRADPLYACEELDCPPKSVLSEVDAPALMRPAPRKLDERNLYLIGSMMQDVIRHGTGRHALQLKRKDLAGKTGTTNDQHDAWFSGYNRDVVTTTWVGFDAPRSMGSRETGARAALPMWVDYMREALRDSENRILRRPRGIMAARIDADTGEFTTAANPNAMFELFREENVPDAPPPPATTTGDRPSGGNSTEGLF